jgi:hypothetical protein
VNRAVAALASFAIASSIALATAGCGGPPPKAAEKDKESDIDTSPDPTAVSAPPPPAVEEKKGPVQPAPFSWEEIRAATKSGRTYRYRVEMPGKATKERVLTFTKVDDNGCEIFAGGDAPRRMGWPTLQKHSEFPKDRTKISEVHGKDGEVTTYYFAKTLPGAPVLFYTEVDGKRVKTTTLLQHIQGKDS